MLVGSKEIVLDLLILLYPPAMVTPTSESQLGIGVLINPQIFIPAEAVRKSYVKDGNCHGFAGAVAKYILQVECQELEAARYVLIPIFWTQPFM